MKISLILMAVLLAVVPVLGLSAPSASAEEVVTYPETLSAGDTIYFNPNLVYNGDIFSSELAYNIYYWNVEEELSVDILKLSSRDLLDSTNSSILPSSLYFLQTYGNSYAFIISDLRFIGIDLSQYYGLYPGELSSFVVPDLPLNSVIFISSSVSFVDSSVVFDTDTLSSFFNEPLFALTPYSSDPVPEDSFVGIWGETAEFVGDIFIQVGDLFYDDTAEELTPIGTLAVILAGIAVVLLVWNLIRSFLPMRG